MAPTCRPKWVGTNRTPWIMGDGPRGIGLRLVFRQHHARPGGTRPTYLHSGGSGKAGSGSAQRW